MSPSLFQLSIVLYGFSSDTAASNQGTCPTTNPLGTCPGQCTADQYCTGIQKCCSTRRCGRICRDPVNSPVVNPPNRSKYSTCDNNLLCNTLPRCCNLISLEIISNWSIREICKRILFFQYLSSLEWPFPEFSFIRTLFHKVPNCWINSVVSVWHAKTVFMKLLFADTIAHLWTSESFLDLFKTTWLWRQIFYFPKHIYG